MTTQINEKDFIEYLKTHDELWTRSNGLITYSEYYDYHDELSADTIAEILKNKKPDTTLETEVQWYLEENDLLTYHEVFNQIVYDYVKKNDLDFDEVRDDLEQLLYDNVNYDSEVDTLLGNSSPDDLHILFGDNWDDEYDKMYRWNEYKSYLEDDETTIDELNEALLETELGWLLTTQGYKPYDVFENHDKELGNKFLNQVYSELFEYEDSLEGTQLTTVLESNNWDAIIAIHEHKPFIIKAGSAFGLYDSVHGSGGGFEIRLEKDIVVKDKQYEYGICESNSPYGYSPSNTYGGSMANGRDNIAVA